MNITRIATCLAATAAIPAMCWAAAMVVVDQKGLAFSTPALTVARGSIVSFMNSDNTSHNILVNGNGVSLDSGLQRPGIAFKAPFAKPGSYKVHCGIHPRMKMTVTVK
jgi:plastocyanin